MAWRKRCKWCHEIFEATRKETQCCSPQHGALWRVQRQEARVASARTAAEASALVRAKRAAERWEGVSPQVAWERGYGAGWYAGRQAALAAEPPRSSPEE
jgi:hypothetical protein